MELGEVEFSGAGKNGSPRAIGSLDKPDRKNKNISIWRFILNVQTDSRHSKFPGLFQCMYVINKKKKLEKEKRREKL